MPSATMPTRTGYTFGGYYTNTGGSGTQYYTSTGASARNWDKTTATTLYAKWTATCLSGHTFNENTKKCEYTTSTIASYRCPRGGTVDANGKCTFAGEVIYTYCFKRLGVANAYCGNYSGVDLYANSNGNCTMYWDRTYCPSGWDVFSSYSDYVDSLGYVVNGKVYGCGGVATLKNNHITCEYDGRPVYSCPSGGSIITPNCDNGYSCSSGIEYTDGGTRMCYNPWQSSDKCSCKKNPVNGQCQDNAELGNDGECYLYLKSPTECQSLGYTVTGCNCNTGTGVNAIQRCTTNAATYNNCQNNVCSYAP